MSKQKLYRGQNKHPTNSIWKREVKKTRQIPGWKNKLLNRLNSQFAPFSGRIKQLGTRINQIGINYDTPFSALFSFVSPDGKLKVFWTQLKTWEPYTKEQGERSLRVSSDTACLMVLVKTPREGGGFDWYLLSRKKYQLGVQNHFIEFSRGWVNGTPREDAGWFLFDRDYPGFRDGGAEFVETIYETPLGQEVWENTADFTNKISYHLMVVVLRKPMTKEELKDILVKSSIQKQYENLDGYPDLSILDKDDLVSEPMVHNIEEAAKLLNAHVEENPEEIKPMFGEDYSVKCFNRFLLLFRSQFAHLLPKERELPI